MSYTGKFREISDKDFKKAIESSEYMVDILEKLGYSRNSGTMASKIKERAKKNGISLSHLKGQKGNRGSGKNGSKWKLESILIENSSYKNIPRLKIRLIKNDLNLKFIFKYTTNKCN